MTPTSSGGKVGFIRNIFLVHISPYWYSSVVTKTPCLAVCPLPYTPLGIVCRNYTDTDTPRLETPPSVQACSRTRVHFAVGEAEPRIICRAVAVLTVLRADSPVAGLQWLCSLTSRIERSGSRSRRHYCSVLGGALLQLLLDVAVPWAR